MTCCFYINIVVASDANEIKNLFNREHLQKKKKRKICFKNKNL